MKCEHWCHFIYSVSQARGCERARETEGERGGGRRREREGERDGGEERERERERERGRGRVRERERGRAMEGRAWWSEARKMKEGEGEKVKNWGHVKAERLRDGGGGSNEKKKQLERWRKGVGGMEREWDDVRRSQIRRKNKIKENPGILWDPEWGSNSDYKQEARQFISDKEWSHLTQWRTSADLLVHKIWVPRPLILVLSINLFGLDHCQHLGHNK